MKMVNNNRDESRRSNWLIPQHAFVHFWGGSEIRLTCRVLIEWFMSATLFTMDDMHCLFNWREGDKMDFSKIEDHMIGYQARALQKLLFVILTILIIFVLLNELYWNVRHCTQYVYDHYTDRLIPNELRHTWRNVTSFNNTFNLLIAMLVVVNYIITLWKCIREVPGFRLDY